MDWVLLPGAHREERAGQARPRSGAPVAAAHLGGCMRWQEAQRLIEKHGVEKMLFGSDLPWSDMARFIR